MTSMITPNVHVENNNEGEDDNKNANQEKMANGITIGTNYRVYAVQKVREVCLQYMLLSNVLQIQTMSGETVQLVRSGESSSYIGSWAPGSIDWEEVDIDEKERDGARRSPSPGIEGELLMIYMDFIRTSIHLEVVHFVSETAQYEPSIQGNKVGTCGFTLELSQKGVRAGGCLNNPGNLRYLNKLIIKGKNCRHFPTTASASHVSA
jgi:calpain-9